MTTMPSPRPIELLAPARDAATAMVAIDCGADAVYIGAPSHGARASATNTLDDIRQVVDYAHRFGARVYVTVNTIVYDNEITAVERMIGQLYDIGVDALIVQDMGILRMDIPPIALHASTQCDMRDTAKAQFLEDVGFSQIVLARELSLSEIKEIHSHVKVPLEAFVHGALCVSYSGDCHASWALKHRSANRGECAQICRLPWKLTDASGREIPVSKGRHFLSLCDMNRSESLEQLLEAGVSSLKIEGRLKNQSYVKNVVTYYRNRLDKIIADNPDKYRRQSFGESVTGFSPSLSQSFNRGYTDYFLHDTGAPGRRNQRNLSSMASPKSIGTPVGRITGARGNAVMAKLTAELANGDGLGYFTPDGKFNGFRLNRVDGNLLYPATGIKIPAGTQLWRNRDKRWDDLMANSTPRRTISISMTIREAPHDTIALDIRLGAKCVTTTIEYERIASHTPQQAQRKRVLEKLGDTPYRLVEVDDMLGDRFIPASTLTQLRRQGIDLLSRTILATHHYEYRRSENIDAPLPHGTALTYHDNVANRLARQFYTEHGATAIEPALETSSAQIKPGTTIMTTRYCLRRELGACLLYHNAAAIPSGDLYLSNGNIRLRVHFDCPNCRMTLHTT